jgi:hypothetical protein
MRAMDRRARAILAANLLLALLPAPPAAAQAWLPTRGTLDLSLSFTDLESRKHYLPHGDEFDAGHTNSQILALNMTYGITDRITITAGLPYVVSRYRGRLPHPVESDDGHTHRTLTDWRLGLHYQLSEGPIAFAPFLQFGSPITGYETVGHAAPGRGLTEWRVGFFAGRNLDEWWPGAYVQLRYAYIFEEKVAGISNDRSQLDLELGKYLAPRWSIRGMLYWQDTYGGIQVPVPPTHPLFQYHDQIAAETFLNAGVGTAYAVGRSSEIYLLGAHSLRGTNGHKLDRSLSIGWTHRFGAN